MTLSIGENKFHEIAPRKKKLENAFWHKIANNPSQYLFSLQASSRPFRLHGIALSNRDLASGRVEDSMIIICSLFRLAGGISRYGEKLGEGSFHV